VFRLTGELNINNLQDSILYLIDKNVILRTVLRSTENGLEQVALEQSNPVFKMDDFVCRAATETQGDNLVQQIVSEPFDTETGPLFRARLICLQENKYTLVFVWHHSICDLKTKELFCEELGYVYNAMIDGKQIDKYGQTSVYGEYATSQADWMLSEDYYSHQEFWKKHLENSTEALDLPTDFQVPANRSFKGTEYPFGISSELWSLVQQYATKKEKTVFQVLLGVYICLLHRYCRQNDIVVGVPYTNRIRKEWKRCWGCFVNVLPLRFNLDEEQSFSTIVDLIAEIMNSVREHQEVPYLDIVKNLQKNTSSSVPSLFRVGFTFDRPVQLTLKDVEVTFFQQHFGGSQLDLMMYFSEIAGSLVGRIEYNSDLFEAETIQRMSEHFIQLVTKMVTTPEEKIRDISFLTEKEINLFNLVNKTKVEYPGNVCIHQLFEAQVARRPEKTAVIFKQGKLTYKELNDRANQIAARLLETGAKADDYIGLFIERTPEMIISILGILKAGCTYVPLEPDHPVDRIITIAEDASISILVTHSLLKNKIPELHIPVLFADQCSGVFSSNIIEKPNSDPERIIYAIFTSGSTGKPKGVTITHQSVVNVLTAMIQKQEIRDCDTLLAVVPFTFDMSVPDLFLPLLIGGATVFADKSDTLDGVRLAELIKEHKVSAMEATPTTMRLLLACGWEGDPSLKVLCGGEPVTRDLLDDLVTKVGTFWNMYGPTETTIYSCCHRITSPSQANRIGKPVNNTDVRVVDKYMNQVPVGIPGELLIGGAGVSKGYLKRPDLNQERFLDLNFSNSVASMKYYRTGDIVRWHSDGTLEYLHRIDNQVKIRGFRIELGEIENVIASCSSVKQCIAVVRDDISIEKHIVAYLILDNGMGERITIETIKKHTAELLPAYMLPSFYVVCETFPLTVSGKIDKNNLPKPLPVIDNDDEQIPFWESETEQSIAAIWQNLLNCKNVLPDVRFFDAGGTSLLAARLAIELQNVSNQKVPVAKIFQFPTIREQARLLSDSTKPDMHSTSNGSDAIKKEDFTGRSEDVAVIGMSCRFPGARTIAEFWNTLVEGKEQISFFEPAQILPDIDLHARNKENYVCAKGIVSESDYFDNHFFGLPAQIAEVTDPQLRLFLEQAYSALEDAGYQFDNNDKSIGVYAGVGRSLYLRHNLLTRPDVLENSGELQIELGNEKDYVATRFSHFMNFKGPSCCVSTACSTSLVAIIMAYQAILRGDCTMAIAGGSNITFPIHRGHLYQEGAIFSKDGHCRPFDRLASGTTFSDGVGIVVLKKLSKAIEDRNTIYAVLKGGAINNDGARKVSYSAPGVDGQVAVITEAMKSAGVTADQINYVETHGTATPLGDPIEIDALTQAFRQTTDRKQFCAIGSVKSNIGHTAIAAGVAGFIKTVLMLYNKTIVPSINYTEPNPAIDFPESPFHVATKCKPWQSESTLRYAGVSSFGFGGTNAHVILSEPPETVGSGPSRRQQLLLLSAKSKAAVSSIAEEYRSFLTSNQNMNLADCAFTLQKGRQRFEHRWSTTCATIDEAVLSLRDISSSDIVSGIPGTKRTLVFMYPGQGNQYVNMGRILYSEERVYREAFDHCVEALRKGGAEDIRKAIFVDDTGAANERLKDTLLAQPAIFATEYALSRLWLSWGITPDLLVGHSIGEFCAACISGIMSLEDASFLVAVRAKLMRSCEPGAMLSVRLSEEDLQPILNKDVSIGAVNSPKLSVVSGPHAAIKLVEKECETRNIPCRRLQTSHAFHSSMIDPAVGQFDREVRKIKLNLPKIPIISTVTGKLLTDELATNPGYWSHHMRVTVRFSDAIAYIAKTRPLADFLEAGPRATSCTLVRQQLYDFKKYRTIPSMGDGADPGMEDRELLTALGKLWEGGIEPDWNAFYQNEQRRLISLPTYPFERKRHWVEPGIMVQQSAGNPEISRMTGDSDAEFTDSSISLALTEAESVLSKLRKIVAEALGTPVEAVDEDATFLQLGMDSLFLTQMTQRIKSLFNVTVSMRQLMRQHSSISKLSDFIENNTQNAR